MQALASSREIFLSLHKNAVPRLNNWEIHSIANANGR